MHIALNLGRHNIKEPVTVELQTCVGLLAKPWNKAPIARYSVSNKKYL